MYAKLTYFISCVLCAVCIFTSCSSGSTDNIGDGRGSEMSFAVADGSRAAVTTTFNRFAVYGDMRYMAETVGDPIVVFDKTEIEYRDGRWTYDEIQHWFSNHEHSFVAVYPPVVLDADTNHVYSDSRLTFTYTLPTSADELTVTDSDVQDIVVATHRRFYNWDDVATPITLRFSHILSLINLSPALDDNIMTDQDYMEIRSLDMSGFTTRASFSIHPAPRQSAATQTDEREIDVTGQDGEGRMSIEFATPVRVNNHGGNVNVFGDRNAIIMLPQTFAADSDVKIVLSYTTSDDPTLKQITVPLANQKWELGKSYTYRFTITRRGPLFDTPTITDWDVTNVGNIDVK